MQISNVQRILLMRRDNIGDLVCTTPAIAALRKHYPNAEIAVLVNSYNADVVNANPNINHVFVYQKLKHVRGVVKLFRAVRHRLRLIFQLRRWKPDVTILARAGYDRHGLNFARQICAKNIIGYGLVGLEDKTIDLPDIQVSAPIFSTLHEVEAVNRLLLPLAISDALGQLQVFPNLETVVSLKMRLQQYSGMRIAVHISAREEERRWGLNNFTSLIELILKTQPSAVVLLFWSPGAAGDLCHPGDDAAAAQVLQSISSDRLIPVPTEDINDLMAHLALCELFIGADGGAMHLAAAVRLKVLALFENDENKLNHWFPWKTENQVVKSLDRATPNVSNISLDQVFQALKQLSSNF